MLRGLWQRWVRAEGPDPFPDPRHDVDAHVSRYQRGEFVRDQEERRWIEVDRVVEQLARQEALGAQRLAEIVVRVQRAKEVGRLECAEEVAKSLGVVDEVTARALELKRRVR